MLLCDSLILDQELQDLEINNNDTHNKQTQHQWFAVVRSKLIYVHTQQLMSLTVQQQFSSLQIQDSRKLNLKTLRLFLY